MEESTERLNIKKHGYSVCGTVAQNAECSDQTDFKKIQKERHSLQFFRLISC